MCFQDHTVALVITSYTTTQHRFKQRRDKKGHDVLINEMNLGLETKERGEKKRNVYRRDDFISLEMNDFMNVKTEALQEGLSIQFHSCLK